MIFEFANEETSVWVESETGWCKQLRGCRESISVETPDAGTGYGGDAAIGR